MLDLVRLYLKAGDGGNGRVAFWRNRHVLKGGPVGGDGGDGGDIVIRVDENLNTLQHFSGQKKIIASDGMRGGKARQVGKDGESVEIKVPVGTVVWLYRENQVSQLRRERYGMKSVLRRDDLPREKYWVEKETNNPPPREIDAIDGDERPNFRDFLHARSDDEEAEFLPVEEGKIAKIAILDEKTPGVIICQGGFGGRGNDAFKSASNTTPMEAEYGTWGEQKIVFLELKLLANVGLVGLPNAGKSTLLSRLTKARPRVADYPFTTLEPHLGVVNLSGERSLVMADIPGLIEGASEGKGLGFDFLRHLDNCRELIYMLSLPGETIYQPDLTVEQKADELVQQYRVLKGELGDYNDKLGQKKHLLVINKEDLYTEELKAAIMRAFADEEEQLVMISAATGQGLDELREKMWQYFTT
ncbi:50S ribosome-binding GTPase [bacterium]|nr:50S ribosome-binding GTPase [bacterium]